MISNDSFQTRGERSAPMMQKAFRCLIAILALSAGILPATEALAAKKPNVVLVFMDNFGYGELGVYGGGITRGSATPRIDALASEGMRLTNFNVEAQCTPSRAAIMTGRYAVRSGNGSVPLETPLYGLTQWEYTMAEMFSDAGYATGIFGKWHLGHTKGRFPTDQGFDEWYGIPNSSDESFWPDSEYFVDDSHPYGVFEHVMEGRKGTKPKKVKVYDSAARLEIDREITDKAKDFIRRKAAKKERFFAFIPYTQTHGPVKPSIQFKGVTGNGPFADVLAQIDAYVGELLDSVEELNLTQDTIFIFTADNGPEMLPGAQGWGGPWRGSYFTGLEGSLRVPFIIRWPNEVPAGTVSNEIVHEMDLFATFAKLVGGKVPKDRKMDSKDQSAFFLGKQKESNRDSIIVYVGNDIHGVKWRNWKMMMRELKNGFAELIEYPFPRFYNLFADPKEMYPITDETIQHLWVRWPAGQVLADHLTSLSEEPPVPPGAPDPYKPAER
jgi:arylsulfatase